MPTRDPSSARIPRPGPTAPLPGREALDWLTFSAAVGLLFNAFHPSGIELKVRPKAPLAVVPPAGTASYAGWGQAPKASTVPPAAREGSKKTPASPHPHIGLQGAKRLFDGRQAVFLDARKPEDYAAGHIPGAVNLYPEEFDAVAPRVLPRLDPAREYVLYCTGSECDLSHELAAKLSQQGFGDLKVFFGGWPEWQKAGYPVERQAAP
jgi:rhodanese-related sulfurtransferase